MILTISVPGVPTAKSRPKFNGKTGRAYTPEKTSQKENEIAEKWFHPKLPKGQEFGIRVSCEFPRPKTHLNKDGEVKPGYAYAIPGPRIDVDNLLKLVLDALNGVAYDDDRFCTGAFVTKRWCSEPGTDGFTTIEVVS